jgi:hypothetical protein
MARIRTPSWVHVRQAGVVQVAVGHGVAHVRDVALDERDQRGVRRQDDVASGVKAVLDLQKTFVNGGVGTRVDSHTDKNNYCYAQLH